MKCYDFSMPTKKPDKLTAILNQIETELKRQNSFGFIFLRGITRGLGTALGATILVALVTSITIHFADTPEIGAFMKSVITSMMN